MKKEITLKNNKFIFTLFKEYYFKNIEKSHTEILKIKIITKKDFNRLTCTR